MVIAGRQAEQAADFEAVFDSLFRYLTSIATRIVGLAEGEQVALDAMHYAYQHWDATRTPAERKSWTASKASWLARDWLRHENRQPETVSLTLFDEAAETNQIVSNADIDQVFEDERIAAAIEHLPPQIRGFVEARYEEHLSHSETAARLGVPESACRKLTGVTRILLRQELGEI